MKSPPPRIEELDEQTISLSITEMVPDITIPGYAIREVRGLVQGNTFRRVKNRTNSAIAWGGFIAPWAFRSWWVASGGTFDSQRLLVK